MTRRRVAGELTAIALLTAGYLWLTPHRPLAVDVGLALVGLGLVAMTWKETRDGVWGPRPASAPGRRRRALNLLVATLAVAALFGAWGVTASGGWPQGLGRLGRPAVLATLGLFISWALLQQTLFQFYLLGRLKVLFPGTPPAIVATANGALYAAVHVPEWDVVLVTIPAGIVWSHLYWRDRWLLPISLSHAILGTTYFSWVRGDDLAIRLLRLL